MRPTPKVINIVKNPVWRAFAKAPMPDGKQRDLSLAALGAFDEIVNGRGRCLWRNRLVFRTRAWRV